MLIGIDVKAGERWMPAAGFDGYQVSSLGRVASFRRRNPILMKVEIDGDGYARAQLRRDGRSVHVVVSRLVCETFNGPPEFPDLVCCHNDNDKTNNHPSNLRWDTQKGNISDKLMHGTHQFGEAHPRAVIDAETARKVKAALLAFPRSRGKLQHVAKETGVPYWVVADISRGKTWGHVKC